MESNPAIKKNEKKHKNMSINAIIVQPPAETTTTANCT